MKIYNQNTFNDFPGDCTIVSLWQIILSQYWITIPYTKIDWMVDFAYKSWKLFFKGAIFSIIYPFFASELSKIINQEIEVEKTYINTTTFKNMVSKGYYYGIWLKNWNKAYLSAVDRWIITKKDIDDIKNMWWGFWHNHVYWKEGIMEVYRWKLVKCSLETLRYWVNQWIWYLPARTIRIKDRWVDSYLKEMKNIEKNKLHWEMLQKKDSDKFKIASQIYTFHKVKNKI